MKQLTFTPFLKKRKVGVAVTLYSRAAELPKPAPISTFTNATPGLDFECAKSSKTGSIILQGGQVWEVKRTDTT